MMESHCTSAAFILPELDGYFFFKLHCGKCMLWSELIFEDSQCVYKLNHTDLIIPTSTDFTAELYLLCNERSLTC